MDAEPSFEEQLYELRRTVRGRNVRETVAAVVVMLGFGTFALRYGPHSPRAPFMAGLVVAAGYVVWVLDRDGPTSTEEPANDQHARQLLIGDLRGQANLLGSAPRWYVTPLMSCVLGDMLVQWWMGSAPPLTSLVAALAIGGAVVAVNVVAARRLEARADRLAKSTHG